MENSKPYKINAYEDEIIIHLNNGKVLLHPTDTIWGLGCRFDQKKAVKKIYSLKRRDEDKALILLVSSLEMLKRYVTKIHPRVENLLALHLRPLTLIYREPRNLPSHLVTKEGTIAIRIVKDHFTQKIISQMGVPLCSTSANLQGEPFPKKYSQISDEILKNVDLIFKPNLNIEGGMSGEPSVMAHFDNGTGDLDFIRK